MRGFIDAIVQDQIDMLIVMDGDIYENNEDVWDRCKLLCTSCSGADTSNQCDPHALQPTLSTTSMTTINGGIILKVNKINENDENEIGANVNNENSGDDDNDKMMEIKCISIPHIFIILVNVTKSATINVSPCDLAAITSSHGLTICPIFCRLLCAIPSIMTCIRTKIVEF